MKSLLQGIAQYLEQQLELYGNEFVLDKKASTDLLNVQSVAQEPTWQQSLDLFQLQKRIKDCTACPLGHTRQNVVFGNGNPKADIVLIGEAPGFEEDKSGFVFVGAAGQLLDKILKSIKLDRTRVYICNIIKCRPPDNRTPMEREIETCRPYLIKQLELIRPSFVLCLGRIAAQTLLRTEKTLSAMRGQVYTCMDAQVVVTYHPAALLRRPEFKRQTWEDVKLLRNMYDEHIRGSS
jgi:DNA polymerase